MTNKEALSNEKAIKILQTAHLGKSWLVKEACEMAIKALEEQKTGHWTKVLKEDITECMAGSGYVFVCSECKKWEKRLTSFCPNCGAKMIKKIISP